MIAYAADDIVTARGRVATLSVSTTNWTLAAQGNLLTIASGGNGLLLGQTLLLQQSAKPNAYVRATKILSDTSIFVVPIQSAADGASAIGTVYTNTATLSSGNAIDAWETQALCTVDLAEARDETQTFLVLASASLSHSVASCDARCRLTINAKTDDPYSGDANHGEAGVTLADAAEVFLANFVRLVTVPAGDRRDFALQTRNAGTSGRSQLRNGHVLALRVDKWSGLLQGANSGTNTAATTAATSTDVVVETVTAAASQSYLVAACALISHSSGTAADRVVEVKVKNNGTAIHTARIKLRNTTDRVPIGVLTFVTGVAAASIQVTINNVGASGNAEARNSILVALPLVAASLPPWLAGFATNNQAASAITGDNDYADALTSASQTLVAGTHIEAITTGCGINTGTIATDFSAIRPVWGGDYPEDQVGGTEPLIYEDNAPARGNFGHGESSATGVANSLNFFLWRGVRRAGSTTNKVQTRRPLGGTFDAYVGPTRFVWLREAEIADPGPDEATTIAVEMETGLVVKQWDPTGTSGLFQKHLPDVVDIDRASLNGVDFPSATVQGSSPWLTTAGTFGWDAANRIAYAYMPASPANRSPNDDRETLVLMPVERLSTKPEGLTDDAGLLRRYQPRLAREPRVRTELQIRSGGTEVGTSIGELEIAAADGKFDDRSVREVWEGLFATIYRGHRRLSGRLADFQMIGRATTALPKLDIGKLTVGLYDRSLQLERPVSESRVTTYTGTASGETPRDFVVLPVIVGSPQRVAAYRVSSDAATPTEHWFKVCQHSVVAFGNVYATADAQTPIATGYTPLAADLLCGQFKVKNAAGGGDAAFTSDTLYVDIAGGVGGGIATAGAVIEFLLQNYPERTDEFAGSPSTTIASANHTSALAGANCQVAATTGFAVGDRVKVVSNAAATTYYHGIVSAILSTPARLTIVPCYETGDAVVGTSFTFGAASSVMKVVFAAGVGVTSLVRDTFRKLDRRWRKQLTGGALIPSAPKLDLVLGSDATVAAAVSQVCRAVFAYWLTNPIGRLFVGVPDQDVASLTLNAGFESDTTTSPATSRSIYPWTAEAGLTAQITTGVRYQGQQAVEITRSALQQQAALRQGIEFAYNGATDYVATALVALRSGDGRAVRLRVTLPSDGQSTPDYAELSDPIAVESGRWSRITFPFKVPRGGSGRGYVDLLPFYPDDTPALPSVIGSAFLGLFTPNTSLVGWLDANNASGYGVALPQNGSKLATWKNLAGGTDATGSGSARPRWWRNALFTRPGVRFDDTNDTLAWLTLGAAPYTVFAVYALSNDDTVTFHRALSGGSTNWMMGPHPGGGGSYLFNAYTGGTGGATGGYVGSGLALAAGQFAYCGLVATSNALAEHFVNGSSVGTNTATSQPAPGVLNLGKGGSTAESLYGTACEVLVWNRALSTGERTAVEAYLAAKYGISAVTLAVDDFETFKLGAVLTDTGADPLPLEYDPDSSFETEVPFDVNTQQPDQASFIRANDSEAKQLTTAVSQAKNALPGAKRLVLSDVALQDAASAAGVACAYSGYFGRLRHRIDFRRENAGNRLPMVGERAIHRRSPRVPELIDEHPVSLLVAVETFGKGGKGVDLKVERQTDLVSDRTTIAASDLPLGLIFVTTASSCPGSGYSEEVVALRGYYVQGALVADTTTPVGSPVHRHQLPHTHDLANHVHTFDFASESLPLPDSSYDFPLFGEDFVGPDPWPVESSTLSKGYTASGGGSHVHTMGSTGKTTGNPTVATASSQPTSTLFTYYGGTDVSWRRVLFCRRTGGTGNFPTTLIAGYGPATAPGGWNRCDGGGGRPNLDGLAIRAARPDVDGTDTTTKTGTTFSPSNAAAGSSLFLTSATNVRLYQRLTIVSGGNTIRVVVVQAPGTGGLAADECKVQTLHEDNDTADVADGGTTYAAGSAVQIDDERPNVSVTIAAHRHQKSGGVGTNAVPDHQHTAAHRHVGSTSYVTGSASGSFAGTIYTGKPTGLASYDGHQHSLTVTTPDDSTASSSAGGDITSATTNAPDRFAMVFVTPADANQNVLPAGIMFFSDSTCPSGFEVADDAAGLLIVGAVAATAGGALSGGHSHGFTANAHTVTHRHHDLTIATGKFRQQTDQDTGGVAPSGSTVTPLGIGVVSADRYSSGHFHRALIENVQSVAATLSQRTSQTSEVLAPSPPALRLVVCRKT